METQQYKPPLARHTSHEDKSMDADGSRRVAVESTSGDVKTAIARSMSRYRRSRSRPPESLSRSPDSHIPRTTLDSSSRTLETSGFDELRLTDFDRTRDPQIQDTEASLQVNTNEQDDPARLRRRHRKNSSLTAGQPKHRIKDLAKSVKDGLEDLENLSLQERKDSQSDEPRLARAEEPAPSQSRNKMLQQQATVPNPGPSFAKVSGNGNIRRRSSLGQNERPRQGTANTMAEPLLSGEHAHKPKRITSPASSVEPTTMTLSAGFDAPLSAVNAGQRKVTVRFEKSTIPVLVTPSTTPLDVICSVSESTGVPINKDATVVLEYFKQLGLERPLRKYEHIRDVLNSWDNDSQNTLIIESSTSAGNNDDLDVRHVSKQPPEESSFFLYHSQKPDQWDKRLVHLRSDGQMQVAKSNHGEASNICHLSDFEIYIPTHRQLAKKIRPPRKICFAIKSQQKSSMFMSTANFVHFFSSSDKKLAKSLYTAVHGWRSWYLISVMGKGQTISRSFGSGIPIGRTGRPVANGKPSRQQQDLTETRITNPNVYPSMKAKRNPVLNSQTTAQRVNMVPQESSDRRTAGVKSGQVSEDNHESSQAATSSPAIDSRNKSHIEKVAVARHPRQIPSEPKQNPQPEPFAATGLLGRTYTQRKRAQQEREPHQIPIRRPNLTHETSPQRQRQQQPHDSSTLKETSPHRPKIKPLIDLTPQYQEPPQHSKKGRGVAVQQIPTGGLIDIATSPDVAIPIPPAATWKRPGTGGSSSGNANVSPQRGAAAAAAAAMIRGGTSHG